MTPAATAPDPRFDPEIGPEIGIERHVPVQDTMLRALGVLRFVVLLNAIGIYCGALRRLRPPGSRAGW